MTPLPPISVIVLNYNSMAHLPANLASLAELDYPADRLQILLVDNDSSDDSLAWAAVQYPQVQQIHNGSNLGFAAGNNQGAAAATGEWLAILNPDTRVKADWLRELVKPTQQEPAVVCVASKMLTWEGTAVDFADAALNFMGWGNQPGLGSENLGQFDTGKPFLFACGGAMLIRRDVFLTTGGFDPDYFAYFEDVDLGWRLWLLGHKIVYAPQAVVYHRHHGSWDAVSDVKRWLLAERNTLFTIVKNYEDDHLAAILPGAILLLLQRAFLDVRPDPAHFGLPPAGPKSYLSYYAYELWQMIRHGRFQELGQRGIEEIKRRLERLSPDYKPMIPQEQTFQPPQDGRFPVPAVAFSRLLAARDAREQWDALWEKRQTVQTARRRPDREIFPLFQKPLLSNFGDIQFIYAMNQVIAKFKLVRLFGRGDFPPLTAEARKLSFAVSQQLLDCATQGFAVSQVDARDFRLGGPNPSPGYAVPDASVGLLAHANQWLWSLPNGDLTDVLTYLQQQMTAWQAAEQAV
jgi:GT2 family glycosyltransferase